MIDFTISQLIKAIEVILDLLASIDSVLALGIAFGALVVCGTYLGVQPTVPLVGRTTW